MPDSKGVRAVLHKLNFYGPGGHFAKHRDLPRAESQFGSLVVSLPAAFEGGQLLRCRRRRRSFSRLRGPLFDSFAIRSRRSQCCAGRGVLALWLTLKVQNFGCPWFAQLISSAHVC